MPLTSELQQELRDVTRGELKFSEPMSEHTTIKIGGPADVWAEPVDTDDLINIVRWATSHDMPCKVLGNGSNTLVRDGGIRGMVVSLARLNAVRVEDKETGSRKQDNHASCLVPHASCFMPHVFVYAEAGVHLPQLVSWALENGLSGLEMLTGIPGTLGGAIVMNAGTKLGSISEVIEEVTVLEGEKLRRIPKEKLEFSYRGSKLGRVVLSLLLRLKPAEKREIELKMKSLRDERTKTQPLIWPSLGSVFKNPHNGPKAWKLIDEAGLRGVRIGGARVSGQHANWIVNEGKAAARDVEKLIHLIRDRVRENSGVLLETEIGVVGE